MRRETREKLGQLNNDLTINQILEQLLEDVDISDGASDGAKPKGEYININVESDVLLKLRSIRRHPRESYSDVIDSLIRDKSE